jgi:hypothetical protein
MGRVSPWLFANLQKTASLLGQKMPKMLLENPAKSVSPCTKIMEKCLSEFYTKLAKLSLTKQEKKAFS